MAEPVYLKIADDIRKQITYGLLSANDPLSSEKELCSKYSVSRMTVRKSLSILVDENLLYSVPGKGYFTKKINRDKYLFLFDELDILIGSNKESQLMEVEIIKPTAELIYHLRVSPDKRIVVIKHLLYSDGEIVAYDIKYIPYFTGIPIVEKEINYITFPEIIASRTSIFDVHRKIAISMEIPPDEIINLLNLSLYDPVIIIQQHILDQEGLPIGFGQLYCHYKKCRIEGISVIGE
ncbi:UTRA domain-containing protein [Acetobacterium paludosum]|uniref:UTRA domain-containing protein n=1 Tax=Acetobacterium paludosum TaxID=52693 RepID=A0A923HW40_9FIRM|nr:GntR family transcriptional regulator [Acetobacterium paludosum]MBC3889366.1 UTRA domain-containing protein [Acetobacterium paludosum]